jgi:hypothetical protein
MTECIISGAWSGWLEESPGRRRPLGEGAPAAIDPLLEVLCAEDFPGRWNPRRAIPLEIEPLALAAARSLERSGWWEPGSGTGLQGGLVVSCEGGPLAAVIDFVRQLSRGSARAASPTGFLFSLPSTAASVLGLLFGLPDYQATVAQGALSGIRALGHAADLLALGRLERVAVAALSIAEGDQARALPGNAGGAVRLAAALCLERVEPGSDRGAASPGRRVEIEVGAGKLAATAPPESRNESTEGFPRGLPQPFADLAAVPLVRLISWLGAAGGMESADTTITHRDPCLAEWAQIKLRKKASWQQATR